MMLNTRFWKWTLVIQILAFLLKQIEQHDVYSVLLLVIAMLVMMAFKGLLSRFPAIAAWILSTSFYICCNTKLELSVAICLTTTMYFSIFLRNYRAITSDDKDAKGVK